MWPSIHSALESKARRSQPLQEEAATPSTEATQAKFEEQMANLMPVVTTMQVQLHQLEAKEQTNDTSATPTPPSNETSQGVQTQAVSASNPRVHSVTSPLATGVSDKTRNAIWSGECVEMYDVLFEDNTQGVQVSVGEATIKLRTLTSGLTHF